MQLCEVMVRLAGSVQHTVPKQNVTPAEIVILQRIHGTDAVTDIRPTRMDKRSHADEYERLQRIYGKNGRTTVEGEPSVLLDRLFPGAIKKLPVTLKDIGLGHLMNPNARAEEAAPEPEPADAAEG